MIPYAANYEKNDPDSGPPSYYEQENQLKWYHYVLLNRPSKVIIAIVLVSILTPLLLYNYILSSTLDLAPADGYSHGSCILPRASRLPCGRENIPQSECHPQCCYDLVNNLCFHRLPSRFSYVMDREWTEDLNLHPRVATDPFASQQSITNVRLSIDEVTRRHLSITFYNSWVVTPEAARRLDEKDYEYRISSPELNVDVTVGTTSIFNTIRGPLIAANDIWETSFQLTNETMYGFGEIPLTSSTKTIYNRKGGLASIPLIFAKVNGTFHGLLIDVDTPTEMFIAGNNQIVVRSITRTQLKFHLFLGPEPKDVMKNVMEFIGFEQRLEYWMLGAHVCSETAETLEESYNNLANFISKAKSSNLPYESHCGTAPIVMNQGFDDDAYSEFIENGVVSILNEGKRHIPHLSPYLRYLDPARNESGEIETSNSLDEFEHLLLRNNKSIYIGLAGNNHVVYPNYGNVSARALIERFWNFSREFSGLLLENTWPLDESVNWSNETHLHLPYFNEEFELAFQETPQWNATFDNTLYLYKHNVYGENFYKIMQEFSANKPVWTPSQWMNGKAMINRQSVVTSWSSLRRQLVEAALGGISGHWLWSSPICGDTDSFDLDTQTNLCTKWYMAGTYLPMIRIHSKGTSRDPMAFVGTTQNRIIEALNTRQRLLPYIFTVLQEGPLLRPMFFQYPHASNISNITTQFSVGDALLIVPNFQPSQTVVNVWLPPGSWFEMWSGLKVGDDEEVVGLTTTEADFITLIRGGAVVALQTDVKPSAEETRRTANYSMTIALNCNQVSCAIGDLFINQNMTIHFNATGEVLTITSEGDDFNSICGVDAVSSSIVEDMHIYGLETEHNNFDYHRYVEVTIDLCDLQTAEQIVYLFL